jgi:hypothetical protein
MFPLSNRAEKILAGVCLIFWASVAYYLYTSKPQSIPQTNLETECIISTPQIEPNLKDFYRTSSYIRDLENPLIPPAKPIQSEYLTIDQILSETEKQMYKK